MGTSAFIPQPGQSLQRQKRTFRVYTDQHGREFEAVADMATNQPIGELNPKGFTPPWLPPMRFAKWRQDGDLQFRWDYDTMANELVGDTNTYYQSAITFAIENHKPEPEIGGPVDQSIRFVLGKPPLSPAIPLAAQAGDPWLLTGKGENQILKEVLEQGVGSHNRAALDVIRRTVMERVTEKVEEIAPLSYAAEKPKSIMQDDSERVAKLEAELAELRDLIAKPKKKSA